MADLYVNVNGTWKTASNYYVNVNGTWKEGSELHAKVSSDWKESGGASIVTTNLILHLDAGNSSSYGGSGTTWSNLVSSSYDATLVNGVGYSSSDGGSLVFDGTNDYATIVSGSGLGGFSGDFTIEFWFKGDDQTAYAMFLDYYFTNSSPLRWGISAEANGTTNMTWWRDSSVKFTTSGVDVFDNAWHHHALVRNGSSINYYIDTVSRGSETYSGTLSAGNSLIIGRYNSGNYWIDGNLAQIRIYSGTGLTSSQVTQNYNATKTTFGY